MGKRRRARKLADERGEAIWKGEGPKSGGHMREDSGKGTIRALFYRGPAVKPETGKRLVVFRPFPGPNEEEFIK